MSEERDRALRSIFKGGMIIFLGTVFSKFAGLAYRVLVGRYLGPADYGVISVMMAVFSVSTTLAYMGVPNGVQKYVAYYRGKDDMAGVRGAIWTGISMMSVSSVIVGTALFVAAPWLSRTIFHEPLAIWPIRMVAVVIPLRGVSYAFIQTTNAFEEMQYGVYTGRIGVNLVKIVVATALVSMGFGYLGAAAGYAVGFGSGIVLATYFAWKVVPDITGPRRMNYGEMIHHSWPLMAAGFFGIIISQVDTFMLQYFRGSAATGLYNAAYPFAMLLASVGGIFGEIYLSNASKLEAMDHEGEIKDTYETVVKWATIAAVPVFLIVFAFPRAVLLVFGKQYYGVADVLRVLSAGFLVSTLIGPVGSIYQTLDRTKLNFVTTVVVAVVNVIVNLALIPQQAWYGGVMGAAIASTTAFAVVGLVNLVLFHRLLGGHPFRLSVLKVLGAGLAGIGATYLVANLLFAVVPAWFMPVNLAVFGLVYAALLLVLRTLEEEDLVILRAIREKTGIESDRLERFVRRFT